MAFIWLPLVYLLAVRKINQYNKIILIYIKKCRKIGVYIVAERYLQQKQHKTLFYRRVGEGLRHYMMKMVPDQMVPDGE